MNYMSKINESYENYLKIYKVFLNEDFVSYVFKLFFEDKEF